MAEVNQEAIEKAMQEIKERKQMYLTVFDSAEGKKVLEDLSRLAFINRTTFNENPQKMAFHEGQRSIILHIQSMMKIDLEKTEAMIKKQSQQEKE